MRRTKLVATLGPASNMEETILNMVLKGVDAFRLNYSHGTLEDKKYLIRIVRKISSLTNKKIPIISDLQGPVVRIRCSNPVNIKRGEEYRITNNKGGITISSKEFFKNLEEEDILIIDDGKILMKVKEINTESILTEGLIDGTLYSNKKIMIKNKELPGEPLTQKDIGDLYFSIQNNIEYIALSMVRNEEDIKLLHENVEKMGGDPWIISKIETPSGVNHIKEITRLSDGVMVARGDLGQFYPLEKIPSLQLKIVSEANKKGKISMVATQILESMINNERPTRAEVTDIFESVRQHVDAILLTGETAVGKHPVNTIDWASKILEEADTYYEEEILYFKEEFEENLFDKFARGAVYMAHLLNGTIIAYTREGNTARRLSRYRPKKPIFVVSQSDNVSCKIGLLYAVKPIDVYKGKDYISILNKSREKLIKEGVLKRGSIILYTVGIRPEATDMLRIETV